MSVYSNLSLRLFRYMALAYKIGNGVEQGKECVYSNQECI